MYGDVIQMYRLGLGTSQSLFPIFSEACISIVATKAVEGAYLMRNESNEYL